MANLKFSNAVAKKPQSCPPIWMMRQAGRYHPPYQKLRKDHSFIELCKKPKLAAEVAMGPMEDFDFDVAILFSDLLFPLEGLGMGLDYNPGPSLGWHLSEFDDLKKMNSQSQVMETLAFQKEAVAETRKVLPEGKSLIGFVGGSWTLFVYAVCGSHKGSLIEAKTRLELFKAYNEIMVPILKENIQMQLDGGAEVVMILDTAAGELSPGVFNDYVVPSLIEISKAQPGRLGYYSKASTAAHLEKLWKESQFSGFGYDHRWDLAKFFSKSPGLTQGNFDQTMLFLKPDEFERELHKYLEPLKALSPEERAGWVCGLGHGILPKTPNENVHSFVRIVRETFNG